MRINIDAIDTLFFRDGKPFTMGSETWANGVFPPPPSVIYGALRSAYFANNINSFNKANKNEDPTKNLKITSIGLIIDDLTYYPLPLDCVEYKDAEEDNTVERLNLHNNEYPSSVHTRIVLQAKDKIEVKIVEHGLFDKIEINKYLNMKKDKFYFKDLTEFIQIESKIGISKDKQTKTTKDRLYRIGFNRLSSMMTSKKNPIKLSIQVEFQGIDLPDEGFLKLGGEGKAVYYQKIDDKESNIKEVELNSKFFILYLSTPAIFENGWLPEWIESDQKSSNYLTGCYQDVKLKLLTATIGKYQNYGGFDIEKKEPKPMYRAVPAGSVYYFELENEKDIPNITEIFHNQSISDYRSEEGFGIAHVGRVIL